MLLCVLPGQQCCRYRFKNAFFIGCVRFLSALRYSHSWGTSTPDTHMEGVVNWGATHTQSLPGSFPQKSKAVDVNDAFTQNGHLWTAFKVAQSFLLTLRRKSAVLMMLLSGMLSPLKTEHAAQSTFLNTALHCPSLCAPTYHLHVTFLISSFDTHPVDPRAGICLGGTDPKRHFTELSMHSWYGESSHRPWRLLTVCECGGRKNEALKVCGNERIALNLCYFVLDFSTQSSPLTNINTSHPDKNTNRCLSWYSTSLIRDANRGFIEVLRVTHVVPALNRTCGIWDAKLHQRRREI